jgi:hypothetical protein|tara:strand:+ start:113 stop:577 length:465 start_codon:yes stop_codon:yes gene_type:complete
MEYGIVTVSEKTLFARVIQFFTRSKWNHVAFYINGYGYNKVIAEMNLQGVRLYSLEEYCKNKDVVIHKNTPEISLRTALHFIIKNEDRKYDFLRTIFFFFKPKDINNKKKWNCIEFVEELFKYQGVELFDGKKLTPGQINKELSSDEDLIFLRK